jgi:hypothetical protein
MKNVSRDEPQNIERLIEEVHAEHLAKQTRPTITIEYQGEPMSLRELSQRVGISHTTIVRRYSQGRRLPELIAPPDPSKVRRV